MNRHTLTATKTISSLRQLSVAIAAITCSASALALPTVHFDNGFSLQSQLTANYTLSTRTGSANSAYLKDPNNDDGTRNFDKWGLINNRVSLFGEVIARYENVGAVLRGSHFYDDVYHNTNKNNSPGTVNKAGNHRKFTSKTKERSGGQARLLDAYVFGNFTMGDSKYLSVKAGRHLVAWGESLFWPNISQGQAPVDATKFNVPGTEAKDAYLPAGQVSFNLALNEQVTLTGFWQYKWEETLLNPVGDFFGSDFFGPGSERFYVPDLNGNFDSNAYVTNAGTKKPDNKGQWGVGVRFNPDFNTEIGLYHYRYHDRTPAVFFGGGSQYSSAKDLGVVDLGTYKFKYFEDIKLTGMSLSTKIADAVQVGGDLSLREGAVVNLANDVGPTTGKIIQTNLNAIYVLGPSWLSHQTTFMAEVLNERIHSVDTLHITGGGADASFNKYRSAKQTKSSTLFGGGIYMDYPSIVQGWDLTTSAVWTQNISGTGAQGFGRDEKRLTLGADFTYKQNFAVGATLVNFLSSASVNQGRLMADRDHLAINLKYTF